VSVPERGEVWLTDLGYAAKTRPVLVLSVAISSEDYALIQVIPHTTHPRGSRFEIHIAARFLLGGVFNAQGMLAVPAAKFLRRLGAQSDQQAADCPDRQYRQSRVLPFRSHPPKPRCRRIGQIQRQHAPTPS
jgi:mRNA interferase MazF